MIFRKRPQVSGFTLIELVLIIVVVGILAAVALPMYQGLKEDAVTEQAQAVSGSFGIAVKIFHSAWLAKGKPLAVDGVQLNSSGWPDIGLSAPLPNPPAVQNYSEADCVAIWQGIMDASFNVLPGNPDNVYSIGDSSWLAFDDTGGGGCVYVPVKDLTPNRFFTYEPSTGEIEFGLKPVP